MRPPVIKTVSSRGQIVIPKWIRDRLKITPGSKLLLTGTPHHLAVTPLQQSITDTTAGSLKPFVPPHQLGRPWRKIIETTKQLATAELAKEGLGL